MACTVLGIVARWGAGSSTYFIEDHWFIIKKTIIFQGSRRVSTFNRVEGLRFPGVWWELKLLIPFLQ